MKILTVFSLVGVLLLTACNLQSAATPIPTPNAGALETMVAATLTAALSSIPPSQTPLPLTQPASTQTPLATNTPQPSSTATPAPTATLVQASVNGKVCYPSAPIPAMNAYFEEIQSHAMVALPIAEGQITYTVKLLPGTYLVYAWLPDFSRGGLYSNAVPCGLKSGCEDHNALPITLKLGDRLQGIDLCDWYAGPFDVPYPPGQKPVETVGSISGTITSPGGELPSLRVVAVNQQTSYWYYWETNLGDTRFTIANLPPGEYTVVAYRADGQAGGYADAAHVLIPVLVKAGEIVTITINDWNGSFPPDPTR